MATAKKSDKATDGVIKIQPGTPEMEVFLQAGYPDMSVEKANLIIKERKENPALWPYEIYQQAQNFLAAYHAQPVAISKTPGWKRKGN